jgi:SAM-dependent methyltransferase
MSKEIHDPLPSELFARLDNSSDSMFYQVPRFVAHINEETIEELTNFYREILFDGADVLDLMSSWISHLPEESALGRVSGLGMNAPELAANPKLNDHVVHDLNVNPILPYTSTTFDFVFIAVSIQYLVRPIEVFNEIGRVLRSNGRVVVATSHRCFPTKAIRAFHEKNPKDRMLLIAEYIRRTGMFEEPDLLERSPKGADPLWLVCGTLSAL